MHVSPNQLKLMQHFHFQKLNQKLFETKSFLRTIQVIEIDQMKGQLKRLLTFASKSDLSWCPPVGSDVM